MGAVAGISGGPWYDGQTSAPARDEAHAAYIAGDWRDREFCQSYGVHHVWRRYKLCGLRASYTREDRVPYWVPVLRTATHPVVPQTREALVRFATHADADVLREIVRETVTLLGMGARLSARDALLARLYAITGDAAFMLGLWEDLRQNAKNA